MPQNMSVYAHVCMLACMCVQYVYARALKPLHRGSRWS